MKIILMQFKGILTVLLVFQFLLLAIPSNATISEAHADGYWYQTSVWKSGILPAAGDTVFIDGFNVEMRFIDATIKRLHVTNNSGNPTQLTISLFSDLIVTDDFYVQGEGRNANIDIIFKNDGTLTVNGPVNIQRLMSNTDNSRIQLNMSSLTRLYANGGFTFDYHNSGASELEDEIYMSSYSKIDVTGDANFYVRGGEQGSVNMVGNSKFIVNGNLNTRLFSGGKSMFFSTAESALLDVKSECTITNSGGTDAAAFAISGGTFRVGDSLNLVSTLASADVNVDITNSGSTFTVGSNLRFDTYSPSTTRVNLNTGAVFNLGGNVSRPYGYGALQMADDALWVFNGSIAQTIPGTKTTVPSTDSIHYTALEFRNTSSSPLTLGGSITLQKDLTLTEGIIQTSKDSLLTISDQTNILGGNSSSYIEGPVAKIGRNNGSAFVFPLGHRGVYAPLQISVVTDANSEYIAQYFSCPPPIGTMQGGLSNVSELEFWTFERSTSAEAVNITLNWMDATDSGIQDLANLVVAYYTIPTGWMNIGNGGTTGTANDGEAGSITNNFSCPPPIGTMQITYGSLIFGNVLPVGIGDLYAQRMDQQVLLNWETEIDVDVDHFLIERSSDAENFTFYTQVEALDSDQKNNYQLFDPQPMKGTNYYRLALVDDMGMTRYSNISAVSFDPSDQLSVFPNPVTDAFNIAGLDLSNPEVAVAVYNQAGQMIFEGEPGFSNGQTTLSTTSVNAILPGMYFVYVREGEATRVTSFVKK